LRSRNQLLLSEEILLLALREDKGSFHSRAYQPAIAAALLAELVLEGRVAISNDKKAIVEVARERPIGDPLLDEVLTRIVTAKRKASAKDWVTRINATPRLSQRVAAGLCRRGILRENEERILVIFRRRLYPEVDPVPERKLIERLQRVIFSDGREVDPRTALLVALASGADLLSIPFPRRDLKRRKARIAALAGGEPCGRAAREVIASAQAAVAAAAAVTAASSRHLP
jgi:hypothetical protein